MRMRMERASFPVRVAKFRSMFGGSRLFSFSSLQDVQDYTRIWGLQNLFSTAQAGPSRSVKEEQSNRARALFPGPVHHCGVFGFRSADLADFRRDSRISLGINQFPLSWEENREREEKPAVHDSARILLSNFLFGIRK